MATSRRLSLLCLLIILASSFLPPVKAQIFEDDFELGGDGYDGWDGTGTGGSGTIATTQAPDPVHHNVNSSKVVITGSGDWGYASQNFGAYGLVYIRFYLYMDAVPSAANKWFGILRVRDTSTGYDMFILMVILSGSVKWRINYRDAGDTTTIDDTDYPPTAGEWRCVEVKINCSSADGELDGDYAVWADGNPVWSVSGIDTDATTCNLMHVGVAYGNIWNAANNVYNDCVVVDSSYIGLEGEEGQELTFVNASNFLLHDSTATGLDLARSYGGLIHLHASDSMNKEVGFQSTGTIALWAATTIAYEWGFTLANTLRLWARSSIGKELSFTATDILHLWSSTATSFEIAGAGLNEIFTLLATLRLHAAAIPTLEVRTPVEHAFNLYAAIRLHDSQALAKELAYIATATIRLWDSAAATTQGVAQELTFILTGTLHLISSVAATMETAALVLDAASIAGLALIIALVAVALIMARRRE